MPCAANVVAVGTMSGKTCLVTGATSGIGKATALELAALGATVIIVARTEARGATAADEIRRRVPDAQVRVMTADLSDMAQVAALVDEVVAACDRLDVLVNNAGVISMRQQRTSAGLDTMFATNHLGPFLLTTRLIPLLERSAPARVVTVASGAHRSVRTIPWDHLTDQPMSYPLSKLLNILFTVELATRLTGVTANCLHPGFIRTELGREVTGVPRALMAFALRFRPGPEVGARTSIYLATSPEVADVTGGYFEKCRPARPSALATDTTAAARLWTISENLVTRP